MINLAIGVVLLLVTAGLYAFGLPRAGQRPLIPDKWGTPVLVPLAIACLGIAGLVMVAKSIFA